MKRLLEVGVRGEIVRLAHPEKKVWQAYSLLWFCPSKFIDFIGVLISAGIRVFGSTFACAILCILL